MLGCKNPGSHQDVAKTPTITNSTNQTLAVGKKVYWSASDGDKGTISLTPHWHRTKPCKPWAIRAKATTVRRGRTNRLKGSNCKTERAARA